MFRAQSNIFDDVVVKATDENLTSENWEYILVCSVISERPARRVDGWRDLRALGHFNCTLGDSSCSWSLADQIYRMCATKSGLLIRVPKMRLLL
jgi:hypothetical protein